MGEFSEMSSFVLLMIGIAATASIDIICLMLHYPMTRRRKSVLYLHTYKVSDVWVNLGNPIMTIHHISMRISLHSNWHEKYGVGTDTYSTSISNEP